MPCHTQFYKYQCGYGGPALEKKAACILAHGSDVHLCCHDHHRSTHTFLLQAPSVVDAFQQAVPTHMQQRPGSMPRPDLMRSGFRPPAARPIANGLAPLKPYSNGPPFGNGPGARPFNQGNFAAENDFGRFGMPLPNIVPPVGMPSANSFVKAQSSEFGVNEITTIAAKRARFETDL